MLLDGRVILVTGASSGIGAATARVIAAHGGQVAVAYSGGKQRAEAVVAQIASAGGQALPVGGDVREYADVERMVDETVARFGRLDGVVNNAIGGSQDGLFDSEGWQGYQNMLDFGAKQVFNTVKAARAHLVASGNGSVVNIVTEIWNLAGAGWSMYMAGKGAMVGMSRSLAQELGPEGIRVNMVAPGWMATERVDTESAGSKGFAASLPLRRHGSADEIGKACVFYLSDLSSYCTGTYLPVCGGRVTQMGG